MTSSDEHLPSRQSRGRLVLGVGLICFGLLFLAFRLHLLPQHFPFELIPVDEPWRLWPMILVVLGLSKLATHGPLHGKGHFLLGLGIAFQLVMLEREMLVETWWPLLLVWWGLLVMLRAINRPSKPSLDPEGRLRPQGETPASVEPDSHE
ncbi:MAG TPA: DUF5668 domain-containing protein [Holophagaceae bacterium]|nr:DUF5668 domain-containing protein [Holophagaceae bacterium]